MKKFFYFIFAVIIIIEIICTLTNIVSEKIVASIVIGILSGVITGIEVFQKDKNENPLKVFLLSLGVSFTVGFILGFFYYGMFTPIKNMFEFIPTESLFKSIPISLPLLLGTVSGNLMFWLYPMSKKEN